MKPPEVPTSMRPHLENTQGLHLQAPNHPRLPNHRRKHLKVMTVLITTDVDIPDAQWVGVVKAWETGGTISIHAVTIEPHSPHTSIFEATTAEGGPHNGKN